ncbi:cytochrome b [Cardiobacteriaceae bacterium TAE3-ERU3]|nr:cytochrome b [Cardiobacteriaceae bacterium TAE3-ERU3]
MAAIVIFLFTSGLYMVTLGYYDAGYNAWPQWHKSFGIVLLTLLILRILWIIIHPKPYPLPNHTRWEVAMAHTTHGLMYLLLLTLVITGYLIATAKGSQINVFGWIELPPIINADNQATLLGTIHLYAAWSLIVLVSLHALGAIKHALIDRDTTLKRMLLPKP